jgi:maleylacetoacetate isomerase
MSLKLYGYWRSSATYRVRIALNIIQLDYDYIPVDLVKEGGQQFSEEYQGLSPAHLVPTFIDDDEDIILNQSMAIIEYLDERYEQAPLLPKHKTARARVRMVSQDIGCDIQPIANLRVLGHLQEHFGLSDTDKIAWCNYWMNKGFGAIEKRLQTTSGDFCFGFDLSMADVLLVPQVYNALRFNLNMSDFPLISQIYKNCNEIEAFVKAAPEKQIDAR